MAIDRPKPSSVAAASTPKIRRQRLVELLSEALGYEKASALIVSTAAQLGMSTFEFSPEEANVVFSELAKADGLVGITAMLGKSRLSRLIRTLEG